MRAIDRLFAHAAVMKERDEKFSERRCVAKHKHEDCLLWKFRSEEDYVVLRDLVLAAAEEEGK